MADVHGGTTTLTTGTASPRITFGQNRVAKGEISPEARSARPVLWFIGGKQDAVTQAVYTGPAISTAIIMDISAKEAVTDFENLYYTYDIRNFFGSTRHDVAKAAIQKRVRDEWARRLVEQIIDSFPGSVGIGLGSDVAQYIELAVLDGLDHFIKEKLHVKFYARYMDDFIIIANSSGMAGSYRRAIEQELDKIHLQLNPKKCRVTPAQKGFKWLGFRIRIKPSGKILVTLNKDKIYHERRKLKRMVRLVKVGRLPRETADTSLQCWAAHAKRGNNHMVINKMYTYYRSLWRDTNV